MDSIEKTIRVVFRHRVFFTRDVFGRDNPLLHDLLVEDRGGRPARAVVYLDRGVADAFPGLHGDLIAWFAARAPSLELVREPVVLPGGEALKNDPEHVERVHSQIDHHHIDRHAHVLAIGGGALLDMVGLAAATAHRGVRHIRLPTTTLAQNDSGVGIKNGINAFGKKNFIGTFAPPRAVINDLRFLRPLPEREKRAGLAEAVKVALIRDRAFFSLLEDRMEALRALEDEAVEWMVRECARIHVEHIATSGDPFETGSARPLDFGHWAAHKLEQISGYRIRHGEAVAVGIALDTVYSGLSGLLAMKAVERVLRLLEGLGLPTGHPDMDRAGPSGELALLEGLEEFREHLGGELTITLLQGLGEGVEVHTMDRSLIAEAMDRLRDRQGSRKEPGTRLVNAL